MSVQPRPGERAGFPDACPNQGAVLVLLYPAEGQLMLPLTLRAQHVQTHKGQISLPGGAREAHDASYLDTALREANEEVGVPRSEVEALGELTPLYIPVSGFCVHPYVGYIAHRFELRADPNEVEQVLEVSLAHLLDPATRQIETHERDGRTYVVPSYRLGNQRIWGATAMILAEFVTLLRAALETETQHAVR